MMQSILRQGVLAVADREEVERFVRQGRLPRALARRFVAGDTDAEALDVATSLAARGMTATLDRLGENVLTAEEARVAAASYETTLRGMAAAGLQPNISVKLTMLGLDIGDDVAYDNMLVLLETAQAVRGFVRIDMEGSAYTERTIAITESLHRVYPGLVGTVIQAALHRSDRDIETLIAKGIRVRLVKGAYAEPASVALQDAREIDAAFARLMERLLEHGRYPAIATHDPALIRVAKGFAMRMGVDADNWEFQMLYGVRRAAQIALVHEGYNMRIYVPFGTDWYSYFARRIAERPANLAFVLRQLLPGRDS